MINNRFRLVLVALCSLVLAACGSDDSQPGENETLIDSPAQTEARPDPTPAELPVEPQAQRDALAQAMRERREQSAEGDRAASREELRERMRERRAERMADGGDNDIRDRLRERQLQASGNWWEESSVAEQLELSAAQRERLDSAHTQRENERQSARSALATAQQELMVALRESDRARITDLLEQRHDAMKELSEIELNWQRQQVEALSDEQLSQLTRNSPQVLIGRQRPM